LIPGDLQSESLVADTKDPRLNIAIIGSGISGLSAAWLLSARHDVTVYERDTRIGGHSNTVTVPNGAGKVPVDTGFIVYNEAAYPNLTALFAHLGVATEPSSMSFAVSLDHGALEYSGTGLGGLLAQRRNLVRPRFYAMLNDLRRFYRRAAADAATLDPSISLGDYLAAHGYGEAFRNDHLLPMAGAIWSAPPAAMLDYPAASFIRFYANHGLLLITGRPQWRTVSGGSRNYVVRLAERFVDRIRRGVAATGVVRQGRRAGVRDAHGNLAWFDQVVIATHADQALAMIDDPTADERRLLGAFRYSANRAVLHRDLALMPKRRATWSSWNFIGRRRADGFPDGSGCTVTYWMNRLQNIQSPAPLLVTLNPPKPPAETIATENYHHPLFDFAAIDAQRQLWKLQGAHNTWFCGSYFGSGFHEDGLQAGLAVAEALGGLRRPWTVANESGRIVIREPRAAAPLAGVAA
jgi:hypothetical protein